jgi:hypothetical protein
MSLRQTTLRPLLRRFAAVTLFVWLGATAMCLSECVCSDSQPQEHHHESATASHDHDDDSPLPANDCQDHGSFCNSLRATALSSAKLADAPALPALLLYTLATPDTFAPCLDTTEVHFSRQPQPRDWVFTPEVCLGPAFRSLAPPVSSVI